MAMKIITGISVGAVDDKVGWILHMEDGHNESFSLPIETARQFMQSLQETVLLLERLQASGPFRSQVGVQEQVNMRLIPPNDERTEVG